MKCFVYGTLKQGHGNGERILKGNSQFITKGIVREFRLMDSGFPVAIHNAGTCITGELFDIGDPETDTNSKATLSRLDSLEGYNPNHHSGMYLREGVTVYGDDGETYEASMYVGGPGWRPETMKEMPYDPSTNTYSWPR